MLDLLTLVLELVVGIADLLSDVFGRRSVEVPSLWWLAQVLILIVLIAGVVFWLLGLAAGPAQVQSGFR